MNGYQLMQHQQPAATIAPAAPAAEAAPISIPGPTIIHTLGHFLLNAGILEYTTANPIDTIDCLVVTI